MQMMHGQALYSPNYCVLEVTVSKRDNLEIQGGGMTDRAWYAINRFGPILYQNGKAVNLNPCGGTRPCLKGIYHHLHVQYGV